MNKKLVGFIGAMAMMAPVGAMAMPVAAVTPAAIQQATVDGATLDRVVFVRRGPVVRRGFVRRPFVRRGPVLRRGFVGRPGIGVRVGPRGVGVHL